MPEAGVTGDSVTSADGTRIGFLSQGHGPGIILINGAMGVTSSYSSLAAHLAKSGFTVHRPDRRGRGLSPKAWDGTHTIERDVEDIKALMEATGATRVFGLSSGAVITLEASRTLKGRITHVAVFEPPFYAPDAFDHAALPRLNNEIESGHYSSALVTSLLTAQTAPAPIRALPAFASRSLAALVLRLDGWWTSDPLARLGAMLPGIRYDFAAVASRDGQLSTMAAEISQPLLVLSGTASPAFLQEAAEELVRSVRGGKGVKMHGLGHDGPWNGGGSAKVAEELATFFAAAA